MVNVVISNINPKIVLDFDWTDQIGDYYKDYEAAFYLWKRRNDWGAKVAKKTKAK